jgi:hypothetical protein
MLDWLTNLYYGIITSPFWLTILYIVPLIAVGVGSFFRIGKELRTDVLQREKAEAAEAAGQQPGQESWRYNESIEYKPSVTIGRIIGRIILTLCPLANLIAAIIDYGPMLAHDVAEFLDKTFNIPLVPKRRKS